MKISRLKKVQKNLGFYINNFKFREPYQILIDGTYTFAALQNQFNIKEQLPKYFQTEVKMLTTACVILEIEKLGNKYYGASLIIKKFGIHKCGHEKKPVSGSKCLLSMIGVDNPSRYIIATQDRELQDRVRNKPGIPLLYLHGKTPTLEPPSTVSKVKAAELREQAVMNTLQKETINDLKKQCGIEIETIRSKTKQKKKNGPNPLSCKKKKKGDQNIVKPADNQGKVRKRKRIKVPAHIKEALKNSTSC